MTSKAGLLALSLAMIAYCGLVQPAVSQGAKTKAPPVLDLDAAPSPESGAPDPLAPPDQSGPAPSAPGATAAAPEQGEADAIISAVRQQLAGMQVPRVSGDREDRAALVAFYADRTHPVWIATEGLNEKAKLAVVEISKADDWGLKASAFDLPGPAAADPSPEVLAATEIKLSLAVLKYARHARGGRLDPPSVSRRFDQKPRVYEPGSVMLGIMNADTPDAYLRGLHPKHEQFRRLQQALTAARVAETAEHGAKAAQRIIANMERWRWMPDDLGDFHVWNSVPEQMTRVIDAGKVVLAEKIVVGRPNTPTPVFSANMLFVIFHPSWGVPSGIKTQELGPQLARSGGGSWFSSAPLASSVLKAHGLQVTRGGVPVNPDSVNWSKVDIRGYDFVQPPGPRNVLGIVKFRFPNKHDVYMHDTPQRELFGGAVRAFSHGCMRVQNPVRLAEILLAHDKGFSATTVQNYVKRGGEIRLTTPIPVHVTYFTVAVDDDGKLQTFGDIYGLDSRVASALEGQQVTFRPAAGAADPEPKAAKTARTKSKTRRNVAAPQSSNPFDAIFGN